MTTTSRTFRIFVSSTFSDLKAERNALQELVFPRLRDLCAAHGCHFQAIDLRWGVSEEAALDQQTMSICLGEIERCQKVTPRPNFIVLLGDRYGWRPLPYAIPADEFEEIERCVTEPEGRRLREWYLRDDNALYQREGRTKQGVYLLQPRMPELGSVPSEELDKLVADPDLEPGSREILERWYQPGQAQQPISGRYFGEARPDPAVHVLQPVIGQDPEAQEDERTRAARSAESYFWQGIETRLLAVLERATAGFSQEARLKYAASATHQEIVAGALRVNDAQEHVFCFLREIPRLPKSRRSRVYRSADRKEDQRQRQLKDSLRQQLATNVHEYRARWQGDGPSLDHVGQMCEDVYAELAKVILAEIEKLKAAPTADISREDPSQRTFLDERAKVEISMEEFMPDRGGVHRRIHDYLGTSIAESLALFGDPGSGLVAFVARAIQRVKEDHKECVDRYLFYTLEETRGIIDAWRDEYNHYRPHSSLGYLPPSTFPAQHSQTPLPDQEEHIRV